MTENDKTAQAPAQPVPAPSGQGTAVDFARRGNFDMLRQAVIAWGADVNGKDPDGCTALHYAAYKNEIGIAMLLIQRGADVNAKDMDGETPLHIAAARASPDVMRLCCCGADVNAKDSAGCTPLFRAARWVRDNAVTFLLKRGADPTARNSSGQTAYEWGRNQRMRAKSRGREGRDP